METGVGGVSSGRRAEAAQRRLQKARGENPVPVEKPATKAASKGSEVHKWKSDLRRMIMIALDNAGGAKYLERQAQLNPVAFMGLLGKILPAQMREAGASNDGPTLIVQVDWAGPGRLSYASQEPAQPVVEAEVLDVAVKAPSAPDIDDLL